jgi:RNA polymerase sigma factor (sigma-70 family)
MSTSETFVAVDLTDADLVARSLAGDREAFGGLVGRYQSLICSLAFSATGSLSQSEDLAQETFVAAWKHLRSLREPAKLRPWLCQIARHLIHDTLRAEGREPSHAADTLDATHESPAPDPLPSDHAISLEEEAILWRSLERIPETYREPLILFYREGKSVERVAGELEISEDAAKQRLSRGRKLLADEVTAFVEGALRRSAPGKAFTVGVIAALPAFAASAGAATIGATAAKGSTTAKAAGLVSFMAAMLGPLIAFFGTWVGYRMSLAEAESEHERGYIRRFYRVLAGCIVGFIIVFSGLMFAAKPIAQFSPLVLVGLIGGLVIVYSGAIIGLTIWGLRARKWIDAELQARAPKRTAQPDWEYRSRLQLLGWPLVHLRIGGGMRAQRKPVKAWIAAGDCAFGLLFAYGGFAVAPVSIGGCAVGLFAFGGFAVGALALGGMALAVWSFGGLAIGWEAYGGCAIAWSAAVGGAAIAREFALGAVAHAMQANNEIAQAYVQSSGFFRNAHALFTRHLVWVNLLWVVPMLLWWRTVARARNRRAQSTH